jgi:hypothetical protein
VFLRHGHGWLVAILFLYYAAALILIAVGDFRCSLRGSADERAM